jgi:UDP-GlcNAc3NAcA epimerase
MQKKIVTVVGARPQFIKAAALSKEIEKRENITEIIAHTGQHYDDKLSNIFFNQLNIPAEKYNFKVGSLSHAQQTAAILSKTEEVLKLENPDYLLVYGDTNSTLAAALAAAKMHIPVVHVEAGLRSFNKLMPEELNRIATDHISTHLFCPTQTAKQNLINENFSVEPNDALPISINNPKVSVVGDVMFDINLLIRPLLKQKVNYFSGEPYALCTIHRAENTDNLRAFEGIFKAIDALCKQGENILFPVHPRTLKLMENLPGELLNSLRSQKRLIFAEPLGFIEMMEALSNAQFVLTDSGGLQKEAYFFNKPILILREQTEWVELLKGNYGVLCGSDTQKIIETAQKFKNYQLPKQTNFYGDGNAAKHIIDILLNC